MEWAGKLGKIMEIVSEYTKTPPANTRRMGVQKAPQKNTGEIKPLGEILSEEGNIRLRRKNSTLQNTNKIKTDKLNNLGETSREPMYATQ